MKITLLLDYPETANPQFRAGITLHGGTVEVVQFGDLFAEHEAREWKYDPFTPRSWHYDFEAGEYVPFGKWRRWQREEGRKMRRVHNPPRQLRRWLPSPTARPF